MRTNDIFNCGKINQSGYEREYKEENISGRLRTNKAITEDEKNRRKARKKVEALEEKRRLKKELAQYDF